MLLKIIIATIIVSLVSFVGVLIASRRMKKIIHYMIAFAAATLLAVSFFDLIPHALMELEELGIHMHDAFVWIVVGIIIFFLVEKLIHWHHCGREHCEEKSFGFLILAGDFVHNFMDGLLIAGAFMLNFATGIITTISVIFHEIPQEFGDFAVLIHAGFKRKKALLLNFISALSAVIGGVLGFFIFNKVEAITPYAVLMTAGGFIYIALSDIVPALHKHKESKKKSIIETIIFVVSVIAFKFFLEALH